MIRTLQSTCRPLRVAVLAMFAAYFGVLLLLSEERSTVSLLVDPTLPTDWCRDDPHRCVRREEQVIGVEVSITVAHVSCADVGALFSHSETAAKTTSYRHAASSLLPHLRIADVLLVSVMRCINQSRFVERRGKKHVDKNELLLATSDANESQDDEANYCLDVYRGLASLRRWREVRFVVPRWPLSASSLAGDADCYGNFPQLASLPPTDQRSTAFLKDAFRRTFQSFVVSRSVVDGIAPGLEVWKAVIVPPSRLWDAVLTTAEKLWWRTLPGGSIERMSRALDDAHDSRHLEVTDIVFVNEDVVVLPVNSVDALTRLEKAFAHVVTEGTADDRGALKERGSAGRWSSLSHSVQDVALDDAERRAVMNVLHRLANKNAAPSILLQPCAHSHASLTDVAAMQVEWDAEVFHHGNAFGEFARSYRRQSAPRRTTVVCFPHQPTEHKRSASFTIVSHRASQDAEIV